MEPPTRVVDALHRGDYSTLRAALRTAKPGDKILLRPGLYREGVVVDKPVEIIGDGGLGEVVIEATEQNTILFKTTVGRTANLTLRQAGSGDWYCVDIAQGRVDLEGCDVSSLSLACVGIHEGADPRLRRNRIHDGGSAGIVVHENGQGTLEDNDIFANEHVGMAIKEGGNPTLRRNHITKNRYAEIWIYEGGRGVFEDNDLRGNTGAPGILRQTARTR